MRLSSKTLNLIFFYRLPVLLLCTLIYWQSSYPSVISQPLFPHDDKLIHFGVYAILAILCTRDLKMEKPFWSLLKISMTAVIFATLFGLSDEFHQSFVPSRNASVYDLVADFSGSMAGCLFYLNFVPNKK